VIAVKVCGIIRVEDARAAVEAGADAIGLNFVPGTPRALEPERAKEIGDAIAGRALRVGVFRDAPLERVQEIAAAVPCKNSRPQSPSTSFSCTGTSRPRTSPRSRSP
jgi:phosphoribosylanthranilate isomerase